MDISVGNDRTQVVPIGSPDIQVWSSGLYSVMLSWGRCDAKPAMDACLCFHCVAFTFAYPVELQRVVTSCVSTAYGFETVFRYGLGWA